MKPYLFLSGLLLGTSISMSSLMADTRVLDASCNDARYGACTSAQTSLTTMLGPRSMPIMNTHVVNVPYSAANSHKNDAVRWGGFITDIENEENHSLILVEFHPLDESGRPQLDQPSEGEFVIKTSKPLDSGIYVEYSEVTVVGILDGDISMPVDEKNESLPLIVSTDPEKYPYLWAEVSTSNDFDFCDLNAAADALYHETLGLSRVNERSLLEQFLLLPVDIVVGTVAMHVVVYGFPIVVAGSLYCILQNYSDGTYDSYDYSLNLWKTKEDYSLVENYRDKLIQLRRGDSDYPLYE